MSHSADEAFRLAKDALSSEIRELVQERLADATGDLRAFAVDLAHRAARVLVDPALTIEEKREATRETINQLRALAEVHRIKAERAVWVAFEDGARRALELAASVAVAALLGHRLKQGGSL